MQALGIRENVICILQTSNAPAQFVVWQPDALSGAGIARGGCESRGYINEEGVRAFTPRLPTQGGV